MSFDKLDFRFSKSIFSIELLVDFWNRFCPVDVGGGGEVLEGNMFPFLWSDILRSFQDAKHNPCKFCLDIFQSSLGFILSIESANAKKSFC